MTATPQPYEYALIQLVPRADRGECMNAGVVLYCQALRYLEARVSLDEARLAALDPVADPVALAWALGAWTQVCQGVPAAGAAGRERLGSRFRWLVAPRSTVVRTGPVHTGLTSDPQSEITRLLRLLVLRPGS
jgi:hypothetical protein